MKKILLTISLLFAVAATGHAQKIAVKTNALGWASALTANAGVEVALWPRWTIAADGYYNPVRNWGNYKRSELWAVQPELKYWFCRKFYSHYIGLHGQYSEFEAGMCKNIYDGTYYGAGLSYGYSLPIGFRWRIDFSLGVGWKHWDMNGVYKRVTHDWDDKVFVDDPRYPSRDTFGVTKVGISAVFIIR